MAHNIVGKTLTKRARLQATPHHTRSSTPTLFCTGLTANDQHLDDSDPVGNIEGIIIRSELDVSLLQTIGADKGVHFESLNVVELCVGVKGGERGRWQEGQGIIKTHALEK